ncbi:hypothetical protein ACOSP7_006684 [Xanthoceras sorbifolium]
MDLLTQHQFTYCPVAIQAYPAPNYKLPIFASLELLHHTPTRPRTPPTRQQPSENEPNRRSSTTSDPITPTPLAHCQWIGEETASLEPKTSSSRTPESKQIEDARKRRRKDQGAKRDGQGAASTKEEELP